MNEDTLTTGCKDDKSKNMAEEKRLKRHLDKFKQYNHEETCQNYEMNFYSTYKWVVNEWGYINNRMQRKQIYFGVKNGNKKYITERLNG